jgi:hypothetical protein
MATVGNIKAKMVLETAEYMAAADKVVGKAKSMGSQLGRELQKAGQQYANSIKSTAMAAVGITSVSRILGDVGDQLNKLDYRNVTGLADAFAQAEISVSSLIKKLPVMGDLFSFGEGLGMALNIGGVQDEANAQRSADERNAVLREAGKAQALKEQAAVQEKIKAIEAERLRIARERQANEDLFEGMMRQQRDALLFIQGGEEEVLFARINRLVAEKKLTAVQEDQLRAQFKKVEAAKEEKRLREQAIADAETARRIAEETAAAEARAAEEAARRLQEEAAAAAQRSMEFSNVESLSTAIGGVKVAGMTSNSIERLVPTQEMIKNYSEQIARNTQRMAGAGAP